MPTDEQIEKTLTEAGKNAPRVTPEDIEAAIKAEWYVTGDSAFQDAFGASSPAERDTLRTSTWCYIQLHNGFTVVGHSAMVSAENFIPEVGRTIARKKAIDQLWPLMGFALRDRLHSAEQPAPASPLAELDVTYAQAVGLPTHQPPTWLDRLRAEREQLHERVFKLDAFLSSPTEAHASISNDVLALMNRQLALMQELDQVLVNRIDLAELAVTKEPTV